MSSFYFEKGPISTIAIPAALDEVRIETKEVFSRYVLEEIRGVYLSKNICLISNSEPHLHDKLQKPIQKLYEKEYIDEETFKKINKYILEKSIIVNKAHEEEIVKYKHVVDDFHEMIGNTYSVRNTLHDLSELEFDVDLSIKNTFYFWKQIPENYGNWEKMDSRLFEILLSEGALDSLIRDVKKSDPDYPLDEVVRYRDGLRKFVVKYEKEIHKAIKADIHKCAGWYKDLYKDYLALKNPGLFRRILGKNPSTKTHGPITNLDSLTSRLHKPDRFET